MKAARQCSSRLLTNANIQEEIRRYKQELHERIMMSAEEVLQETAQLASFDPLDLRDEHGQLKDLADMDAGTRKSIQEISMMGNNIVSVKFGRAKRLALDMLMKVYNKYDDQQMAGNGEIKVMMYCAQDANL